MKKTIIHLFLLLIYTNNFQIFSVENNASNKEDSFRQLFTNAITLFKEKKLSEAAQTYKKALKIEPESYQAWFNYGICLVDQEKWYDALDAFQKSIVIKPDYARAHHHLSKTFTKIGRIKDALKHLKITIQLEAETLDAYVEITRIYKDDQEFEKAFKWVERGLRVNPEYIPLLFEKANTLNIVNKIEESLEIYLPLLDKIPNSKALLYNIAYTLKKLGRIEESLPYYDKVISLYDHPEAEFSRGLAYLQMGQFEKGWQGYEKRWNRSAQKLNKRYTSHPEWDGSDLTDKKILLYGEQGFGDGFQFFRYALEAKKRGGYVIVAIQNALKDITSLSPFVDKVIGLDEAPPEFDVQAALMSLPYILGTTTETIPSPDKPYLYADEKLVELWKERLSSDTNFKIGICWQGNNKYSTAFLRSVVAHKSIDLETMLQIADIPGVSVYSLQKMTGEDQIENTRSSKLHVFDTDFDTTHGRFMDTAAVMKNLDLVITIDTSISHLAAGLGVPTWNLLPKPYDWRWILNKTTTPWYNTMRLFIQPTPGDWQGLITEVKHELKKLVQTHKKDISLDTTSKNVLANQLLTQRDLIKGKLKNLRDCIKNMSIESSDAEFEEMIQSWIALRQLYNHLDTQYQAIV